VFNILLQVLDDGRLTDGHGRTVDLRNTVIVMTSNLGSQRIQAMAEEGYDAMKEAVLEVVGQHFRPEFINRVDEMVVFHPLDQDQIRQIAGIQLERLRKRLEGHGFGLVVSDEALDFLGEAGFDPVYGARPLKRAIQNEIENPLAQKILSSAYAPGDTIQVDVEDGRFTFD
jgi:ATP-dependent Clp protease ATP-binding subunit ClpB